MQRDGLSEKASASSPSSTLSAAVGDMIPVVRMTHGDEKLV